MGNYLNDVLLNDVLRAEVAGLDLQETSIGIDVCAMDKDKTVYTIGCVSMQLIYQYPQQAKEGIERIKFARTKYR